MRLADLKIPFLFALGKLLFHVVTNRNWGFHRDEFLYIALGRNPDLGFWSNPPLTSWISWFGQNVIGEGQGNIRFLIALFSAATVFLCCLMTKELGGKTYAQILAGIASTTGVAAIRSGHLFQPVGIDIFFWTLATYLLLRLLKTNNTRYLLYLGLCLGFGFLNKYTVLFLIAALAIGLLLTPARRYFSNRYSYYGAGLALIIVLPNLIWQWINNFPVMVHMQELSENQLSAVEPISFLSDQLLFHLFSSLVWLAGLYFLLVKKSMLTYRPVGWFAVATVLLFLLMSGKSYYTLGIFPTLLAAGAVFLEKKLIKNWLKWSFALFIFLGNLSAIPSAIPFFSVEKQVAYFKNLGVESLLRWERGNIESLPQDYADMLGWPELAALVAQAVIEANGPKRCLIYAENYGQAGAIQYYAKQKNQVVSFSDSYKLWMPDKVDPDIEYFIYVNDELGEDVAALFQKTELIGTLDIPHARENGTQVYLCSLPKIPFNDFWDERVKQVKKYYGMD